MRGVDAAGAPAKPPFRPSLLRWGMRTLMLLAAAGCVTGLQPRGGELVSTAPRFSASTQLGTFTLGAAPTVLVFYRGHW